MTTFSSSSLSAADWTYSGEKGPDNWAQLHSDFGACGGRNQSPIYLTEFIEADLPDTNKLVEIAIDLHQLSNGSMNGTPPPMAEVPTEIKLGREWRTYADAYRREVDERVGDRRPGKRFPDKPLTAFPEAGYMAYLINDNIAMF